MTFEIRKGVPIPEHKRRDAAECPFPFDAMEKNDSFSVPVDNEFFKRLSTWTVKANLAGKDTGRHYITRTIRGDDGVMISRDVWRDE
jgi:hypothetical protein